MAANLNDMKADTENILIDWQQEVTIKRKSISYNNLGEAQVQWQVVVQNGNQTIPCDIQPLSGDVKARMYGLDVSYSHQIFLPAYADIQPEDRIYVNQTDYFAVAEVAVHPDHVLVFSRSEKE
jgi:hypothetical protein